MGFGEAVAYGAGTIINAIATGKGAAFGVNLWTKARVRLTNKIGEIEGKILSEPSEDMKLIKEVVRSVFEYFKVENEFGAYIETESNIPIAKGLKSSSVAANALVLASTAALGKRLKDANAINLSIDSALRAKTTITGAFDDTCASFFGNIVLTDNLKRRIIRHFDVEADLVVLFHVPPKKSYTYTSDVNRMRLIAPQVNVAFKEALSGNYWTALTLNGILYSAALGYDPRPAISALEAGAIASGLSGKGPATVAITKNDAVHKIIDAWRVYSGDIIQAGINKEKSKVMRKE
ncbi:shikimate kinase [Candidatus Bathyarchaeota archaeon]|nr:shikimate kinase [Candidatus Bathyarchaeota archaeon]